MGPLYGFRPAHAHQCAAGWIHVLDVIAQIRYGDEIAAVFNERKELLPFIFGAFPFGDVLGNHKNGGPPGIFQEVREKRGLCYSIYAFHAPYTDTGFFGLYTGTDPGDAPEMMEVIVDVINEAVETLTEAEITRAKAQMKAGLLMALESSGARAEQIARQMIVYGRPMPIDEIVAKVDAVTVESTRAAGRALIARSRPAVAALGPSGLEAAAAIAESLTLKAA